MLTLSLRMLTALLCVAWLTAAISGGPLRAEEAPQPGPQPESTTGKRSSSAPPKPAEKQPARKPVPRITDKQLAGLNHEKWAVRQEMTDQLLQDDSITPQLVADAYKRATTWEQKQRLLDVGRHHLLRTIREDSFTSRSGASVGLAQAGVPADPDKKGSKPAIRVVQTFPGFPAYAYLKPGDLITAINGKEFHPASDALDLAETFGKVIREHKPGDTIKATLYRNSKPMTVSFQLADFTALTTMYDTGPVPLRATYREKWDVYRKTLEAMDKRKPIEIEPKEKPAPDDGQDKDDPGPEPVDDQKRG